MTMERHRREERLMERHFAGSLPPPKERELRLHLEGCAPCRRLYERHMVLAELEPGALPVQERLARGLGVRPRRFEWRLPALATAVATACLLLVLRPAGSTFAPRGGGVQGVALRAWTVGPGGTPRPLVDRLAQSDALAFAYANAAGRRHLMVLGVDEHRHIYWYHPAWTDAQQNPTAVPIAAGPELRELPEAVSHRLDGSRMTLFALFTDRALDVRSVEDAVRRWDGRGSLPLGDAGVEQVNRMMEVVP